MSDITIDQYYKNYDNYPLIDVRSPGEFLKGHIPGAYNIPLFSDEERAKVGTTYKYEGKDKAIELGYQFVNPKLHYFIEEASKVAPDKKVALHCWRGGMRSHAFANHLVENGFSDIKVIQHGYKAFRNFILSSFDRPVDLKVIGGYTGSGKTHILKALNKLGCQVIDLEKLAHHKGSAFGGIGENNQPTVEQFENNLFMQWQKLDINRPVFIEDESHNIGAVKIPMNLFTQMRNAKVYFIDVPKVKRAKILVSDYAGYNNELLKAGILKISKRLGGLVTQLAIDALEKQDYLEVAMLTLNYYDKSYMRGLSRRSPDKVVTIKLSDTNPETNGSYLKEYIDNEYNQAKTEA